MTPLAIMLLACGLAPDKEASVTWEASTQTAQVGEPVELRLVFTNMSDHDPPAAPQIEGAVLTLVGGPFHSEFTQFVNGRKSHESKDTYAFRLVADRAGTVTLPAMEFKSGRKTYSTQPLTLTITQPPPQAENPAEQLVYAELEVDRRQIYVTQEVKATLRIGIRMLERGGAAMDDRDTLVEFISRHGKFELSGFDDGKFRSTRRTLVDARGASHEYYVLVREKTLRADEPGTLTIGPVAAFVEYPTQYRVVRGLFGAYELDATRTQRVTARSEAITVTVKSPPAEGQPDSFTGALGSYSMEVSARPETVERDQPITLSITIRGRPLEGVEGPDLAAQPELAGRFDYRKDTLTGELTAEGKVFRQAIFPRQDGAQTIPPIRWSYFDPDQEQYVAVESDPVAINVLPPSGRAPQAGFLPDPASERNPQETALKTVAGGLSANITDPAALLADAGYAPGTGTVVGLLAPPALAVAVVTVHRRRRRLTSDRTLARRTRARRRAETAIRQAARDPSPAVRSERLASALTAFLADRFDLPPGAMTPEDTRRVLESHGAPSDLVSDVRGFLGECETARYAGGIEAAARNGADDAVRRWIVRIESTTRP